MSEYAAERISLDFLSVSSILVATKRREMAVSWGEGGGVVRRRRWRRRREVEVVRTGNWRVVERVRRVVRVRGRVGGGVGRRVVSCVGVR